jgi:hypothetical protein
MPGVFTQGTAHFANAQSPADTARTAAYERVAPFLASMGEDTERLMVGGVSADPQIVADEIVRVIDLPPVSAPAAPLPTAPTTAPKSSTARPRNYACAWRNAWASPTCSTMARTPDTNHLAVHLEKTTTPFANLKVPAGSLTAEQKKHLIDRVTDLYAEVFGEAARPNTMVSTKASTAAGASAATSSPSTRSTLKPTPPPLPAPASPTADRARRHSSRPFRAASDQRSLSGHVFASGFDTVSRILVGGGQLSRSG